MCPAALCRQRLELGHCWIGARPKIKKLEARLRAAQAQPYQFLRLDIVVEVHDRDMIKVRLRGAPSRSDCEGRDALRVPRRVLYIIVAGAEHDDAAFSLRLRVGPAVLRSRLCAGDGRCQRKRRRASHAEGAAACACGLPTGPEAVQWQSLLRGLRVMTQLGSMNHDDAIHKYGGMR